MAQMVMMSGWILNLLGTLWIVFILLDILLGWIFGEKIYHNFFGEWLHSLAQLPVDLLRRVVPTVYRNMDFASWLAILLLVVLKTFVFRSMVYWGMLHRLPLA